MTTYISIVTWNRRDILARVLDSLEATTPEPHVVLVTDNGSTDGTVELLMDRAEQGKLRATLMPENVGSARARNAHWAQCIGHPAVKLDDKVEFLCPGWLTALETLSAQTHALLSPAYDPTVSHLETLAPCLPWIACPGDGGVGGPYLYVPAEVSTQLGVWDELPGVVYGWEDVLYVQRARLLGWNYGWSMRSPAQYLAQASEAARQESAEKHPIYVERLRQYREAERDLNIPMGVQG